MTPIKKKKCGKPCDIVPVGIFNIDDYFHTGIIAPDTGYKQNISTGIPQAVFGTQQGRQAKRA